LANVLRIKRSTSTAAPSTLANAELAYSESSNKLFIGIGTGGVGGSATTIQAIGGDGAYTTLDTAQTISGNKNFSGSVVLGASATATTPAPSDNSTTVASTAYVKAQGYGTGSVTSVALSLPSFITVSGSPVTSSGTLSGSLTSQTANTVFVAPDGSAGSPTFRALLAADIPTLTAAKISNFDTQVRTSRLDQMTTPTASVSFGTQAITNLADPTNPQDAATKNYVDGVAQGLDVKGSVKAATTANITLSGAQTIDGISLTAGDRCLVKAQTLSQNNGIYVVAAGAWTRSTDMDAWAEVPGAFTFVEQGTTLADTGWVSTANAGGTLGTTSLDFAQFSGAGSYTAGNGLTLTGSAFSVTGTSNRISVSGSGVDIASTYVGQSSITTLGTIATGTWNGSLIDATYGGTGVNNGSYTITLGGNVSTAGAFTTSGAFGITLTATATTSITLPTSGTLLNDSATIDGGSF
jgi:hypothetical protein